MTKRPGWTAEEVVQKLSEDDLDDPDKPVMDGSDDEFSNLELDSDYDDNMMDLDSQPSLSPLPDPGNVIDSPSSDMDSAPPTPPPSTSQAAV